ncbi:MAG: nucleoside deaminase [OCS116 cluster bacterium]|nr:nucleoside deaminase [OCS116 cluster bacterium]
MNHKSHMQIALDEAHAAEQRGEVPIGAVIVDKAGKIIARAGNETRAKNDPTAHAEILAIRRACHALGVERLNGHDLYVTLEPCNMCATAISFARINRLYYAAEDVKGGAVDNGTRFYNSAICHHAPEVIGGLEEVQASQMLSAFFAAKR